MIRKIQNYINLQICFEAGGIKPSGKQRGLLYESTICRSFVEIKGGLV